VEHVEVHAPVHRENVAEDSSKIRRREGVVCLCTEKREDDITWCELSEEEKSRKIWILFFKKHISNEKFIK